MDKVILCWSSGKDSLFTLKKLLDGNNIKVVGLLTTITENINRVAMHSTRRELVMDQSKALEIPIETVEIPNACTNDIYKKKMSDAMERAIENKITHIAFGDIFLQDIREYRENMLKPLSLIPIFPLWEISTKELSNKMIDWGLKAVITCVDSKKLSDEFVGRQYNREFIDDLPNDVDPCGENGEFHTFVYDCPLFKSKIDIKRGEIHKDEQFVFCDFKTL